MGYDSAQSMSMMSMRGTGITFVRIPLISLPETEYRDELTDSISKSLQILESTFSYADADSSGVLTYQEFSTLLVELGFAQPDRIASLFYICDLNEDGYLDFFEFCVFLSTWSDTYSFAELFVRQPGWPETLDSAFAGMKQTLYSASSEKTTGQRLYRAQVEDFLRKRLSTDFVDVLEEGGALSKVMGQQQECTMTNFFRLLYLVLFPKGRYAAEETEISIGVNLREDLQGVFHQLEEDFIQLDKSGDDLVDFSELTSNAMMLSARRRIAVTNCLDFHMSKIDVAQSGSLDFAEFVFLAMKVVNQGGYTDIMPNSKSAWMVKRVLARLHFTYQHYDLNKNGMLELSELKCFFAEQVDMDCSEVVKKVLPGADFEDAGLDMVAFIKVLYIEICIDGRYVRTALFSVKPRSSGRAKGKTMVNDVRARKCKREATSPRESVFDMVDTTKLRKIKCLGQGGQGTAYLAEYEGLTVAAKWPNDLITTDLMEEIQREVRIATSLKHKNIHCTMGAKIDRKEICILSEVCSMGSLDRFLHKNTLSMKMKFRFAKECADAFLYMHTRTPMVAHFDIKAANVFLDDQLHVKIADFGMAEPLGPRGCFQAKGTPYFMAPEVWAVQAAQGYDERADVYSYGMLLWEIFHGKYPFYEQGFENVYQIMCAVLRGVRPTIHSSVPKPVKALMRSCWQPQPKQRPHFREIVDGLETAWQHYQAQRPKPPKPRPPRPKEERLHTSPPRIARAAKKEKASSEPRRPQKQDEVADATFLPPLPQAKRHNRRKVKDKTASRELAQPGKPASRACPAWEASLTRACPAWEASLASLPSLGSQPHSSLPSLGSQPRELAQPGKPASRACPA
ncbi:hypothetical protein CYMTET_8315 [Cymbomonas tetramitiformis]|uniref:Uncharacterized protein n=1 Tax=Cymbomonas tetramitiformis TaxID=36881 RepID=A0AAE0LGL8_9CHLO|nr:hypothetical protein CYMTET_8315 [Cymbomonas tetramitiformis]